MSLDRSSNALAAGRPNYGVSDPRMVSARQPEGAGREDVKEKDRLAFADLLRARQVRPDKATDKAEHPQRADDVEKVGQSSEPVAAQDLTSIQKDQTEARSAETPQPNTDRPVDAAQTAVAVEIKAEPLTIQAPETVSAQDNVDVQSPPVPVPALQVTTDQALAEVQVLPTKTVSADLKAPEPKSTDAMPDIEVKVLAQAMSDLKSAFKGQVTDKDAIKTAHEAEGDKPVEPTLTDAQLNQLMQALLSGKPLSPELKSLSETPKVAEALKAVRSAVAALEPKRPDVTQVPEAILALAAETETTDAQAGKASDEANTPDVKADVPFGALLGAKPAASPTLKGDTQVQTSTAQVVPETVATQTAPTEMAAKLTPKPSEAPLDFKPAPIEGDNNAPVAGPAATKAAEGLQLGRSEAALGSNLSTAALNNLTHMSAQIARHMSAKSTQFNMELHPADMGRVDVKLSINHDGTMSAALSFDSPVAESQFRAQADELRRQLEAQGFQLTDSALSFSSRQGSDQASRQGQSTPDAAPNLAEDAPDASRAAQAFGALEHSLDAPAPGARLAQKLGLDLLGAQTYRLSLNVTA